MVPLKSSIDCSRIVAVYKWDGRNLEEIRNEIQSERSSASTPGVSDQVINRYLKIVSPCLKESEQQWKRFSTYSTYAWIGFGVTMVYTLAPQLRQIVIHRMPFRIKAASLVPPILSLALASVLYSLKKIKEQKRNLRLDSFKAVKTQVIAFRRQVLTQGYENLSYFSAQLDKELQEKAMEFLTPHEIQLLQEEQAQKERRITEEKHEKQRIEFEEKLQKMEQELADEKDEANTEIQQLTKELNEKKKEAEELQQVLENPEIQRLERELGGRSLEMERLSKQQALSPEKEKLTPAIAFGAAQWNTYFGDVGDEPPLPSNMDEILQSPCPFWEGKKVEETHLLVLVPQTVDGKPLTLKSLGELVKRPKQGGYSTHYRYCGLERYTDAPASASHWVLMTRDVIPESRKKLYAEQQKLVNRYAQKAQALYEIPHALDAVVCLFMEYVRSGIHLYPDHSCTYTRCQEWDGGSLDWLLSVGEFSPEGLDLKSSSPLTRGNAGVGASRKL